MIGLDIDNYGEDLVVVCSECGWIHTLEPRPGWLQRGDPTYLLEDIVALAKSHDCLLATVQP